MGRGDGAGTASAGLPARQTADFLARALREPLADDELRVITIPAPRGAPEAVLGDAAAGTASPAGDGLFWTTPGGPVHAGLGTAAAITADGPDRFDALRREAGRLWARTTSTTHPAVTREPSPRLFGGLAFLPGPLPAEWRSFGAARFVLPRVLYTLDGGEATVSLALTGRDLSDSGPEALADVLEAVVARVRASSDARVDAAGEPTAPGPDAAAREAWRRAVRSIQRRIGEGRAEKIVAARSRAVPLGGAGDLPALLHRLARESATAARFAFRFGDGAFVGATPERLVTRVGRELRTEALAGSVAADSPEREERLLASLKEEAEHDYVVRAIAEALDPLCERLDRPTEPRVQRLRHVLHLQTPFVGRLREPVHVLELVERLHPTPAVGGWPRGEALAWIDAEEPGSRGWYAAPVGWFDAAGDGDFGVALRSGLLHRGRAHLYAGAGIVRDSDPDGEFDETEVKLRTMLDALGLLS